MQTSWTKSSHRFKSPLRVVVQFLIRSRETFRGKYRKLRQKLEQIERVARRQELELEQKNQEIRALQAQVQRLEPMKGALLQEPAIRLPDDPPIKSHGYGARMVSLAVNLIGKVGLRGAAQSMEIFFEWLGIEEKVPHWTTIRCWTQRVGLAALQEPYEPADDWAWIADHSNQIGPEKVLVVEAIRTSKLPPPGETIKREMMRVLAVEPGKEWKQENVAAVYEKLAKRYGAPRQLLIDGAVELRDSSEALKKQRADVFVGHDFKHKAANYLKGMLEHDADFTEFTSKMGRTRAAIQQTPLAYLTPPTPKSKSRFMNLGAILEWSAMVLWLLDHPQVESDARLNFQRLEEKLGWMRSFTNQLAEWRECQQVVNKGVTFVNKEGLVRGGARRLLAQIAPDLKHPQSRKLAAQLLRFVRQAERHLKPNERLLMSTEILESSFAVYKQLERQHSKGGFTSLLPAFPALLKKTTPASIQAAFTRVSVQDVRQWVQDQLGDTIAAQRQRSYRAYRAATQGATKTPATC